MAKQQNSKWFDVQAAMDGKPPKMYLYDDIGFWGVTAADFVAAMPQGAFELHINSRGGSVYDGLAIYNAARQHDGEITGVVDGIAASMASVILCACKTRIMAPGSMLFVHDPIADVQGDKDDLAKAMAMLETVGGSLAAIYMQATGTDAETVAGWMAGDTLFSAEAAVAAGLATSLASDLPMAASLDPARLPEPMAAALAAATARIEREELTASIRAEVEAQLRPAIVGEVTAALTADFEATAQTIRTEAEAKATAAIAEAQARHAAELEAVNTAAAAKVEASAAALELANRRLSALGMGGFGKPESDAAGTANEYWEAVAAYKAAGLAHNDAVAKATQTHPAAHKAMIAAANRKPTSKE
jgi:ATP-dependent Clp protease, protease subunit